MSQHTYVLILLPKQTHKKGQLTIESGLDKFCEGGVHRQSRRIQERAETIYLFKNEVSKSESFTRFYIISL